MMSDTQASVVAFLKNPTSYAGPDLAPPPVTVIETHAAMVFLCGAAAYKLKRAVRYPYLDYSTVALRHEFLLRELTLNRMLAPDLYRTVWAITQEPDGRLVFQGQGTVVDWVLVMHRFADEDRFDHVARSGRMTEPLLRALADTVAGFHARTPPVSLAGGALGMKAVLETTLALLGDAPDFIDHDRVRHLDTRSHQTLTTYADLLDLRAVTGKVRRCHGDLHLENICVMDGKPVLFDRLEFDDRLANIDILYDLAFLLMDFLDKDYRSAANYVFNQYLDQRGETIALALMPLFLSMRAAIRAYVLLTQGRMAEPDRAPEKYAVGQRFFRLAEAALEPAPVRLVAIGGLSGTGKTTLARHLAPSLGRMPGARILRSDVMRKKMLATAPETPLPVDAYTPAITQSVYQQMRVEASAILDAGHSVILDAVSADPNERRQFEDLARYRHVPFSGFWLDAPIDLCRARIAARTDDASDATPDVRVQQARYDLGVIDWHRLDAVQEGDDLVRAAMTHLVD